MERVYTFFGAALAVWGAGTILESLGSPKFARLVETVGVLVVLSTILWPEINEAFRTFGSGFGINLPH